MIFFSFIRSLSAEPQGRIVKYRHYCIDSDLKEASEGDRCALISPLFPLSPSDLPWFLSLLSYLLKVSRGASSEQRSAPLSSNRTCVKISEYLLCLLSLLSFWTQSCTCVYIYLEMLTPFRVGSRCTSLQ